MRGKILTLTALEYAFSMDRFQLKNLFFMGKFDTIASSLMKAESLRSTHIKKYIKARVFLETRDAVGATVIELVLSSWTMPMRIHDADAGIAHYCSDFHDRLPAAGYVDFRDTNLKQIVKLLLGKVYPTF